MALKCKKSYVIDGKILFAEGEIYPDAAEIGEELFSGEYHTIANNKSHIWLSTKEQDKFFDYISETEL